MIEDKWDDGDDDNNDDDDDIQWVAQPTEVRFYCIGDIFFAC